MSIDMNSESRVVGLNPKQLPTQDRIRELFDYNFETGELSWKFRDERDAHWNKRYAGTIAGYKY